MLTPLICIGGGRKEGEKEVKEKTERDRLKALEEAKKKKKKRVTKNNTKDMAMGLDHVLKLNNNRLREIL